MALWLKLRGRLQREAIVESWELLDDTELGLDLSESNMNNLPMEYLHPGAA